jgi:hypothetical protein
LVIFKRFAKSEKMKKNSFIRYYWVFKNETSAATVSTNRFYSVKTNRYCLVLITNSTLPQTLHLPAPDALFYGYSGKSAVNENGPKKNFQDHLARIISL